MGRFSLATTTTSTNLVCREYCLPIDLPEPDKCLGVKIGEHIKLGHPSQEGEIVLRPYVPISRLDNPGDFDLLIKRVKCNVQGMPGKLTSIISSAEAGEPFFVEKGKGKWGYHGMGDIEIQGKRRNIRYLIMFAQDTGITSFFQVIETISFFPFDTTSISLIYSTESLVNYLS